MSRNKSDDYEHLYEALELMFEEEHYPTSKLDLKNLMGGYGFLNAMTRKGVERQINVAWKRVKKDSLLDTSSAKYGRIRPLESYQEPEHFKLEKDVRGQKHKRAKESFVYKGKKYRKGQFLPKELRE